jgi:hypothetical protein
MRHSPAFFGQNFVPAQKILFRQVLVIDDLVANILGKLAASQSRTSLLKASSCSE